MPDPDPVPLTALTGTIRSADGTMIAYDRIGNGPVLVVIPGTVSAAAHHRDLARALATERTVIVTDRRGRGRSDPFTRPYSVDQELADLHALIAATGAEALLGISSGAILALLAARSEPAIRRVIAFEPPILPDAAVAGRAQARVDAELANGRVEAALVTAMTAAELGPAFFRRLPRAVTERMTGMMLRREDRRPSPAVPTMRSLAPSLHADLAIVAAATAVPPPWAAVAQPVLLLGGSRSPAYLGAVLAHLETHLPDARRQVLDGLDHGAPWNRDLRGDPDPVAEATLAFLRT